MSSNADAAPALAVVIPMYDEASGAERCVRTVTSVLAEQLPAARLFVVNDGSRDGTGAVLERLVNEGLPFTFVDLERNAGYGGALRAGAQRADRDGFTFALFMDSDLTNDPALIPAFWGLLSTGRYDVVKASRYVRGGGMRGVPAWRRWYTIVGNRIASRLFGMGIRDCTNGFRAVRLSALRGAELHERGFPSILEELLALKRRGARAAELPYVLTARDDGASKFSYAPRVLWAYLKYALLAAATRPRGIS
jgi:glycosyltransferase involved in cell wall biosynthesis